MRVLELLAPARNADIGIAAIDCGADAVYMAGPGFGARKDAGNSLADVARVCSYAHTFGARVFLTVNTIIYEDELEEVHTLMLEAQDAGVDAFIIQDPALTGFEDISIPLHASTQCSIRTPQKAAWLESLGCSRVVLERELSLNEIRAICDATDCEVECFVHGALCVCYSGQCYMSENVAGRSANRGECIQACRSLYDLEDADGKVLVRDKALLSLKDLCLIDSLEDLSDAGVQSFKIEGRLKNISYVRNVVRAYSEALDALVARRPEEYCRASFGSVSGGVEPELDKTFNRGYTSLFLHGRRGRWSSMDAPKGMGEHIGSVRKVRTDGRGLAISVDPVDKGLRLANGDGFSVITGRGIVGFRGDVCDGLTIRCKAVEGIHEGDKLFRNLDTAFEKALERETCRRNLKSSIDVHIGKGFSMDFKVTTEDGRELNCPFSGDMDTAENTERQLALFREQLSKHSGVYDFRVHEIQVETPGGRVPLLSAAILNSIRRLIASDLDGIPCAMRPLAEGKRTDGCTFPEEPSYKADIANPAARGILSASGAENIEDAYELTHRKDAELMRTKYCIRHELGMCPVHQGAKTSADLFLRNQGRRFALHFDCKACEMTVKG